jgi:hypothetical protein
MPKYRIMGERTLVEAWTYHVVADNVEEAIEKIEANPDGLGDSDLVRLQDDQVYEDSIEFTFLNEIKEPKSKSKK